MFTGIIEELGVVKKISRQGNITLLEVYANKVTGGIKNGDSISFNGICLTVVKFSSNWLIFEVMPATINATSLKDLRIGEKVNLERSLRLGDRVSGHFVLGHVDCIGIIRKRKVLSGNKIFEISIPAEYIKYCILKDSVAVDGISLTIQNKGLGFISVYVIPYTFKETTLGFKGPSDRVNIEFDILAKNQTKVLC